MLSFPMWGNSRSKRGDIQTPRTVFVVEVRSTLKSVWDIVRNGRDLSLCIPGCKKLVAIDERTFLVDASYRIGLVPFSVELRNEVVEEVPPNRLVVRGHGEHVDLELEVKLREARNKVTLRFVIEVNGRGPLGPFVDRFFESRLADYKIEFSDCFRNKVESGLRRIN